jgi:hypothetical protein
MKFHRNNYDCDYDNDNNHQQQQYHHHNCEKHNQHGDHHLKPERIQVKRQHYKAEAKVITVRTGYDVFFFELFRCAHEG